MAVSLLDVVDEVFQTLHSILNFVNLDLLIYIIL